MSLLYSHGLTTPARVVTVTTPAENGPVVYRATSSGPRQEKIPHNRFARLHA